MKKKLLMVLLLVTLGVGTTWAQFGGIVYDPTNYSNALLRYFQLQQHLIQLRQSYMQLVAQYNLAVQMARNIQNMPARYRATFSPWRGATAHNTYGNTGTWINGINSGQVPVVSAGYAQATTQLLPYNAQVLAVMTPAELERVKAQYASVELADGANLTSMATVGAIRNNSPALETRIANLEQDSLSGDANLNSEVAVLNKINAASVMMLRTVQDSNKLLASLLEQQTIIAKQQREAAANSINADIARRATLAGNLAQVTSSITNSQKASAYAPSRLSLRCQRRPRSNADRFSAIHLPGHQRPAYPESRVLRCHGPESFSLIRDHPGRLVRRQVRARGRRRQTAIPFR